MKVGVKTFRSKVPRKMKRRELAVEYETTRLTRCKERQTLVASQYWQAR